MLTPYSTQLIQSAPRRVTRLWYLGTASASQFQETAQEFARQGIAAATKRAVYSTGMDPQAGAYFLDYGTWADATDAERTYTSELVANANAVRFDRVYTTPAVEAATQIGQDVVGTVQTTGQGFKTIFENLPAILLLFALVVAVMNARSILGGAK